jgi:SMI1-KNR4 cell-wall
MDHPCFKCGTSTVVDQNSPAGHPLEVACANCGTSCVVAGGAPELTISQAEAALGVRFPPSYRSFLAQYGAGFWKGKGLEIAGLFHQPDVSLPPYWENVVTWNLRERRGPDGLSPRYVAFSHDGMDATFLLDTGASKLESPVVVLGPGWDFIVIAVNFNAFVTARLNNLLRY